MANFFDQFDEETEEKTENFFDQFDEPEVKNTINVPVQPTVAEDKPDAISRRITTNPDVKKSITLLLYFFEKIKIKKIVKIVVIPSENLKENIKMIANPKNDIFLMD